MEFSIAAPHPALWATFSPLKRGEGGAAAPLRISHPSPRYNGEKVRQGMRGKIQPQQLFNAL